MDLMDLFGDDAFRMITMTEGVNKRPYQPDLLGRLGIFTPEPIRTLDAVIGITDEGNLTVVQTSERGAPPVEQKIPVQNIRSFRTPRLAVGDTIYAYELQSILARSFALGGDQQLMLQDLQSEIAYRLDGPGKLRSKIETTKERHRLGAISGIVLDADGSTLYDWPTLLGMSLPAEIGFDLSAASPTLGALGNKVRALKRSIRRAAKVGNAPAFNVIGLCGDDFFDAFVNHPDVVTAYALYNAGTGAVVRLAAGLPDVEPFSTFNWGGIAWINYEGTDDNSTISIDPDQVKFVPVGVPGLFREILSPGESFDYVNTPGLPIYTMILPDRERNQSVRIEAFSYPMYVATRPDALFSGRRTA